MIQTLLFFGLGFLSAVFIVLLVAPAYRRRLVRLTTRRIEATVPMTREEIQAEKDKQRSEFAVAARRLEMDAENARRRFAEQAIAVDRLEKEGQRLTGAIDERDARISELEAEIRRLGEAVAEREGRIAAFLGQIDAIETDLTSRSSELQRIGSLYEDASLNASSRQIEIVARETEIDRLSADIASLRSQRNDADRRLREIAADNKALREAMKNETRKADELGRKVEKLMASLSDRDEKLERRESELARLKGRKPAEPQGDAADAPTRLAAHRDRIEADLTRLAATGTRKKKRPGEADFAAERARLRGEIQTLAAQMVNFTASGEVADDADLPAADAELSLADRIEAVGRIIAGKDDVRGA